MKMATLFRKLLIPHCLTSLKRNLHASSIKYSYEEEGKTTVTILNKNLDYGLMIDNISEYGFTLNNGVRTVGPMIIFPKTMLSWNIASSPDMSEESFSLLLHLYPKLDIVVIGLDQEYPQNAPFLDNIRDMFRKHKIPTEILPVYRACSTFNFLNSEHRYVVGALIPPKVRKAEDILLEGKKRTDDSFEKYEKDIGTLVNETDPLVTPEKLTDAQSDEMTKQKKLIESLEVRSPWKNEDKKSKK